MSREPYRSIHSAHLQLFQVSRQEGFLLFAVCEIPDAFFKRAHPNTGVQSSLHLISRFDRDRLEPESAAAEVRQEHINSDDTNAAQEGDHVRDQVDARFTTDTAEFQIGRSSAEFSGDNGAVDRGAVVVVEAVENDRELGPRWK